MRYISTIISSFIRVALISLITFIWLNDIFKNSYLAITFSIIVSAVIEILLSLFYYKKDNKEKISKEENKEINKWKTQLQFMSNKQICDIYSTNSNNIIVSEKDKILIKNGYDYIMPVFDKSILNCDDIASIYKYAKSINISKLHVHCLEYKNNLHDITQSISDINITLYDINYVYKNIIKNSINFDRDFNNIIVPKNINKVNYFEIIFNKKLIKNYVFSGILLLFASFFTKYSILYEITGTILIVFSLICILRKKKKITNWQLLNPATNRIV